MFLMNKRDSMSNPIVWIGLVAMVITVALHFLFDLTDEQFEEK